MKTKLHFKKTVKLSATVFALALCSNYGFSQTNLIQNPTADFYTVDTNENADSFDMTPNSTLTDNNGITITSPYRYDADDNPTGWRNTDLESYIAAKYGSNEQPNTTGDGTYDGTTKTRGLKLSSADRRIYQLVQVTSGTQYTFTVATRSESALTSPEIFILNNEITTEDGTTDGTGDGSAGIDGLLGSSPDVDAYLAPSDVNSSKGDADTNTFTTSTLNFTASTNQVVIYIRALGSDQSDGADGNDNEFFADNLSLVETASLSNKFIDASAFSVSPNPVKNVLNIQSSDNEISSVSIKNMLGQEFISTKGKNKINVSSLASGVYLVVINSNNKVVVKKFIKE